MKVIINSKLIKKTIYYSQQIEGYKKPTKEIKNRVSQIRMKYNVKVSINSK